MGDPWGIGGFRGRAERANPKKKSAQKFQKSAKSEKKIRIIFTGNGVFSWTKTKKSALKTLNDDFASDFLIKHGILASNVIYPRCWLG